MPLLVNNDDEFPQRVAENANFGGCVLVVPSTVLKDEAHFKPKLLEGPVIPEIDPVQNGAQVHWLRDYFLVVGKPLLVCIDRIHEEDSVINVILGEVEQFVDYCGQQLVPLAF